ncbi:MAG TPA: 50S ribosomal protein L25 [Dehalococcoidia bacterium]|nr:50S ribosomal protein L25 [Dehalococcoidia bacterium]
MDRIVVEAQPRQVMGKKVRHLRKRGITPANLSGLREASEPIQVDAKAVSILINKQGKNSMVNLRIGSAAPIMTLLKDYTVHPIKNTLIHVDFQRVAAGEKLTIDVDLHYSGDAPVDHRSDLLVLRVLNSVRIECLPRDLPNHLEVDTSVLAEADDVIRVRDLQVPAGVTVLNDPDEIVARVSTAQAVPDEAEEAAEEAAEAAGEEAARAEVEGEQPAAEARDEDES